MGNLSFNKKKAVVVAIFLVGIAIFYAPAIVMFSNFYSEYNILKNEKIAMGTVVDTNPLYKTLLSLTDTNEILNTQLNGIQDAKENMTKEKFLIGMSKLTDANAVDILRFSNTDAVIVGGLSKIKFVCLFNGKDTDIINVLKDAPTIGGTYKITNMYSYSTGAFDLLKSLESSTSIFDSLGNNSKGVGLSEGGSKLNLSYSGISLMNVEFEYSFRVGE